MVGTDAPAKTPPTSGVPAAGAAADSETIRRLLLERQKLLDHITALNKNADSLSDLMTSAVSKLLELDQYTQEVEAERDSLKQSVEVQKRLEDELNSKIVELEERNEKQKADLALVSAEHAAAIQASWDQGRAQGMKEMKEAINVHLNSLGS